jgi:hypothetical protein
MFNGALFIFEISIVVLIIVESIIEAVQNNGVGRWYWLICVFMSFAGIIGATYILMFPLDSTGNSENSSSAIYLARIPIQLICVGTLLSLIGIIVSSIRRGDKNRE